MSTCFCPHCNARLEPREVFSLAMKEIMQNRKPSTPEEIRARRLKILRKRARRRIKPGCWFFEIWGTGLRIGSYSTREKCVVEIGRLRKNFPDFKFILHDPVGNVYVPKKNSERGCIEYRVLVNTAPARTAA